MLLVGCFVECRLTELGRKQNVQKGGDASLISVEDAWIKCLLPGSKWESFILGICGSGKVFDTWCVVDAKNVGFAGKLLQAV